MSVGTFGPYDFLLRDKSSSATVTLGLILVKDEEGRPLLRESRVEPLPPRISSGALDWQHHDPTVDFHWVMKDWSKGGGRSLYRPGEEGYYTIASGVETMNEGVLSLGYNLTGSLGARIDQTTSLNFGVSSVDFLVRNAQFATGVTTPWTGDNSTTLAVTSNVLEGTSSGSLTSGDSILSQSLGNPTVYRGRQINVYADIAKGDVNVCLYVTDGVGEHIEYSSAVSSTSLTAASVTSFTVDGAADQVTIGICVAANESGSGVYKIDNAVVVPTGGVTCKGMASEGGALYGIFGRVIAQWDETNKVWDAVYIHSGSEFNSIVQHDGDIFAAFDDNTAYVYGATTSWLQSTIADKDSDPMANLFVVARNQLWKAIHASVDATNEGMYVATDPRNGGSWSSVYKVGTQDTSITGIYTVNDTIAVGKEEGFHLYNRMANDLSGADLFKNITNSFATAPYAVNFSEGVEWRGWLYLRTRFGFWRFNGQVMEELNSLLISPRANQSTALEVVAMAADSHQLWVLLDRRNSISDAWLAVIRDTPLGLTAHYVSYLGALKDTGTESALKFLLMYTVDGLNSYMWVSRGNTVSSNQPPLYRIRFPVSGQSPAYTQDIVAQAGYLESQIWDGGLPDMDKALTDVTLICADLDAEHTVKIEFGKDGDAATTTTIGTTSTTSNVQTFAATDIANYTTVAVGKTFQIRLTLASDDTIPPKVYAVALHFTLRPRRVKLWEATIDLGAPLRNGLPNPTSKTTLLADLDSLETQVYPIYFTEDFDQNDSVSNHFVTIKSLERILDDSGRPLGGELYRLVLQEAGHG